MKGEKVEYIHAAMCETFIERFGLDAFSKAGRNEIERKVSLDFAVGDVDIELMTREQKFVFFSLGTAALAAAYGGIQWYSLLALPLLMLYNGQRGKAKLKNLFYLYYPAHLVALQLVAMFI